MFIPLWILFVCILINEPILANEIDDAYYDGDQQELVHVNLFQTLDCSNQCPPHWIEPVIQQKQTLVYPASAFISLKCPFYAKPKAKITWYKDGQIFLPELYDLVTKNEHFKSKVKTEFRFFLVFN